MVFVLIMPPSLNENIHYYYYYTQPSRLELNIIMILTAQDQGQHEIQQT